ncbi:MAG: hypothetical protein ACOYXT_07090 [Bacteroidota bacterium]
MNKHRIIAGVYLAIVILYWAPTLVNEIRSYRPQDFLSGLTLLVITFIVSFILLGLFGILGWLKNIKQWMVSVAYAMVAVKQLFDAAWFENILFLILFAVFLGFAVISQYVVKWISLQWQIAIMNLVGIGLSIWAMIAEALDQL